MINKDFNFTKNILMSLPVPSSSTVSYRDTKEKGLSLYVTPKGAKSFFVRKRINGRDERVVLGQFPDMTVEGARKAALKTKNDISQGISPNLEKKKIRAEITFGELFHRYLEEYSKVRKKSWKYDQREIDKFLSHWKTRRLSSISRQEVVKLHQNITSNNGPYQANRIVERIRGIFNKGIEWGWDGENPASKIKKFPEKARDRFIQPSEFPFFFAALAEEESETINDYLWISLFTGARKSNVLAMRWQDIDWHLKQWRIPETKNGDPLTVVLSQDATAILERRQRKTNSLWVFPSIDSKSGHLADPKRAWNRIRLNATIKYLRSLPVLEPLFGYIQRPEEELSDARLYKALVKSAKERKIDLPKGLTDVRIHDLRRTLGSYQAIIGASQAIIGKSLGHKSIAATQIYARLTLDPVRDAVETATAKMMDLGQKARNLYPPYRIKGD